MGLVLDATPGASSANAWATVAAFRAWAEGEPRAAAIVAESNDSALALALVGATRRLEQEEYLGDRTVSGQALAFPRYGLTRDGLAVDVLTIPRFAEEALFHEALALYTTPTRYNQSGLAQFVAVSVGPVSVTPRPEGLAPDALTPDARRLLAGVRLSGSSTFRFLRGS